LADVVALDGYDVAVADVMGWPHADAVAVRMSDDLFMNVGVLTVEYSPSDTHVRQDDGTSAMNLAANYHQGHMVREYLADFGHERPTRCVDLSYPAFRRASGAPVLAADSGEVLAMVVANVERHLLPAHMQRIERDDPVTEELRNILPHGQAIRAEYLRAALDAYDANEVGPDLP
jgi:hypothetical protein